LPKLIGSGGRRMEVAVTDQSGAKVGKFWQLLLFLFEK
jgi:hypothetical protein